MTDSGEAARLRALNAVLKILVRHANLLQPQPFEELADAVAEVVSFLRIALLVPEGPDHRRVYAVTRGPTSSVPFGARAAAVPAVRAPRSTSSSSLSLSTTPAGAGTSIAPSRGPGRSYVVFPCAPSRRATRRG